MSINAPDAATGKKGKTLEEIQQNNENHKKKLLEMGWRETKNFGWVSPTNWEKYEFLRRDNGIPVVKDKDGHIQIDPVYFQWKNELQIHQNQETDKLAAQLLQTFGGQELPPF